MISGTGTQSRSPVGPAVLVAAALCAVVAWAVPPQDVRTEVRRLLGQAHDQLAGGDTLAASASLDTVLALAPADPDAPHLLASISLARGDTAAAVVALEEAVASAPMSCRLKLLLAWIHFAQGRDEPAELLVQEALSLRPREADGLYLRGRLALAAGDSAATLASWERLLTHRFGGNGR